MAQHGLEDMESPTSGDELVNGQLEPTIEAIYTTHSGTDRPTYVQPGMIWLDTTTDPWVLNMYKGSSTDMKIGEFDITTNKFTAEAAVGTFFTAGQGDVVTTPGVTTTVVISSTIPDNFELVFGQTLVFVADNPNAGATTIAVNGGAASPALKVDPATGVGALQIGDLIPGLPYFCFYDGTNWLVINVIYKPYPVLKSSNYTATFAEFEASVICSNTSGITITLNDNSTYANYYTFEVFAYAGNVTLAPHASDQINDKTAGVSIVIPKGSFARVRTDAAGKWYVLITSALFYGIAVSDEITDLTTGTAKVTVQIPHNMTLFNVFGSLTAQSTSGAITVDINKNGTTMMTTNKLTIDANEDSSATAATPAALTTVEIAAYDKITIDIDGAGTGAKGLKVWLIGRIA